MIYQKLAVRSTKLLWRFEFDTNINPSTYIFGTMAGCEYSTDVRGDRRGRDDRAVAAMALVRIAEAYQKMESSPANRTHLNSRRITTSH